MIKASGTGAARARRRQPSPKDKGLLRPERSARHQAGGNHALRHNLCIDYVSVDSLSPLGQETRKHPARQIQKLQSSLEQFGFVAPILIDPQKRVIAGWGLVLAARKMRLERAPVVTVSDLAEAQARALRLALNRLAEDSSWDPQALALEFSDVISLDASLDLTIGGFESGEIDFILDGDGSDAEDEAPIPEVPANIVTRSGDVWQLGDHRVICGDALQEHTYERLLEGGEAQMVFTDPPYNVKIGGHVSGQGKVRHREFAMGSGELSEEEFVNFLAQSLRLAVSRSVNGSIHFVCMDWRHMRELYRAGDCIYSELKNVCVWNKTNAGMGSLYRSKHELVFVFKAGHHPHINNVDLGRHGRHRSNVWDYAGQTALGGAKSKLSLHPTVKPVAMVADAIRDCSNRGGLILDPFGGAGTTLIAAERTGRRARLIEIDAGYVDVIVQRWERLTGRVGLHLPADPCIAEVSAAPPEQIVVGGA